MTNRKLIIIAISICTLILTSCGSVPDRAVTLEEILGEESTAVTESTGVDAGNEDMAGNDEEQSYVVRTDETEAEQTRIYIFVCGAVVTPGVVELPEGSRIRDALEAAGGFREDACTVAVNLAARLIDGEQIFFPTQKEYEGDVKRAKAGMGNQTAPAKDYVIYDGNVALVDAGDNRININSASSEELQKLPGIGEARARDIISFRDSNGGFKKIEDIMKVSGIKENTYSKICTMITV